MGKKWYKVSFFAEMSEADVKAMQGSFFAAIDKQIFDDFKKDHYIDIKFIDEDHEPINRYVMVEEDDEWIHCDFLEAIR